MTTAELLAELGYSNSPNFLSAKSAPDFDEAADFAHIFRQAITPCNLQGVYTLRQKVESARDAVVPIVYVCEAADEADAHRIHRLVWNQNVVPFLIVTTQTAVRLYSGFRYERQVPGIDARQSGILRAAQDAHNAFAYLESFKAGRINDGSIWEEWGAEVTPETRVDWKLLNSLNDLDRWLRENGLTDPEISHGLIGKYVYLHYLRRRNILSNRKLDKWDLRPEQVFGRKATLAGFWRVIDELDDWLNGSMFPLSRKGEGRPTQDHIRKVAGTFAGDEPASGQLALDFEPYDFSFIPVETLSVIYEQFLHSPSAAGGPSKGKARGAYYTPVPLVNFMLEELDVLFPLREGMTVLDPSCGSGAFLVQCFRRLIHQDADYRPGQKMRPKRLRELLEQHIYGIDRDGDACRVAELSLSLTLLDYVDPPDLETMPTFRLPQLHDKNIFQGDFFDPKAAWCNQLSSHRFDWIVGNPPWIELSVRDALGENCHALDWILDRANQLEYPVGGNQVAEAFVWKAMQHLAIDGHVALLLPAMTLFKDESTSFRKKLFSSCHVKCVANFANFAEVLFPGHSVRASTRRESKRPRRPAAAFFFQSAPLPDEERRTLVLSPLVAEQVANRPTRKRSRKDTWNIVVNTNEVREVRSRDAKDGNALLWKAALWGSDHDRKLLQVMTGRFPGLSGFCGDHGLKMAQGFELRDQSTGEATEPIPEIIGQKELDVTKLKNCGRIYAFPDDALKEITSDRAFLRLRGGRNGLEVSRPPHIIVDATRRFAVYSNEFIAIPPRKIGIAGSRAQAKLLKALALYLVSDFALYHQFLTSPEWGVSTSIATLDTLKLLPIPVGTLTDADLKQWEKLHTALLSARRSTSRKQRSLFGQEGADASIDAKASDLEAELNELVFDLLEMKPHERWLVEDLVNIRMTLIQGKVSATALRNPSVAEIEEYAHILKSELDNFIDDQPNAVHDVSIMFDGHSAMVLTELVKKQETNGGVPYVRRADDAIDGTFDQIRQRVRANHSQWLYFERNLRLFEGKRTFLFKPMNRLHWTRTQAVLDAGSIISDTLS